MSLSFSLRGHFKGLMFDCHRQQVALMVTPISKASVGTSADAARMSAYATMVSAFYRVSPKTKWHWAPTPAVCDVKGLFQQPAGLGQVVERHNRKELD